jgi:hypothetical protein
LHGVADAVHEQQPVGQTGERVVKRLVLQVALDLVEVDDLSSQTVLGERPSGVVRERVEQPQVSRVNAPPTPRRFPRTMTPIVERSPGNATSIASWIPSRSRNSAAGPVRSST